MAEGVGASFWLGLGLCGPNIETLFQTKICGLTTLFQTSEWKNEKPFQISKNSTQL